MDRGVYVSVVFTLLILFSSTINGLMVFGCCSGSTNESYDDLESNHTPQIARSQSEPPRSLANSSWPMFRGNPQHTGLSPFNTSDNPGCLSWRYKTNYSGISSAVIGPDNSIYFHHNNLFCFDQNGKLKLTIDFNYYSISNPAILADGTIYICADELYAYGPTGTLKWLSGTNNAIISPVVDSNGIIYFGSTTDYFYAYYPDGTMKWSYKANGDIRSSPAIGHNGTIYFGSYDNYLYALNPDGTLKWKFRTADKIYSSPAVSKNGTIYFGSYDNYLYALNPNGSLLWKFLTNDDVLSSPAISPDGIIYVGSDDNRLYAINPNGTIKWFFTTGGNILSSPTISADGIIFVGSFDGHLRALNPDGSLKWKYTADSGIQSSPTIDHNGTIYFSSKYHLYAIGKGTPEPPRNLTFEEGVGYINLTWDTPESNGGFPILRYKIYRGIDQSHFELIGTVASSIKLFKDIILDSNQSHIYHVTAINVKGESLPSNHMFYPIPRLADSQWPMFRNNLKHTGLSSYDTQNNPGKIVWEYDTYGYITASPVIGQDGSIYIGSHDNYLYALNYNGTLKWKFYAEDDIYSTAALASDGSIYFCCYDYLYALYPNGTLKWRYEASNRASSSPTIGPDGTIYFGSEDNYLYAVYPNGSLKWNFLTLGDVDSVPAIDDKGIIYFGSEDNYLYSLNPDGSLNWDFYTNSEIRSSPAIGLDGTIYIGSGEYLYALYQNGKLKWKNETYGYIDSSPAIGPDGTVYIGTEDGYLYALSSNEKFKWSFRTQGDIESSPAIGSDGTIFFGSHDEKFYAISSSGNLKWSIYIGDSISSSPAIGADGTVYIGSYDSKLYAIGYASPTPIQNLKSDVDLNHINLSWEPPIDNGGSEITEYRIYKGNSSEDLSVIDSVNGLITTYIDSEFEYYHSYFYYVTAVNSIGESNVESIIGVLSPSLPGPPVNLYRIGGEGYIDLFWEYFGWIGLPIERFNIYRGLNTDSLEFIDYVSPWTKSYRDPHVTPDQRYYYYVTAVNALGESKPTDIVSTTPLKELEKPSAPTQLLATAGEGFILLSWEAPNDAEETNIFEYEIYRGNLFGDQRLYKAVKANQTSFNDTKIYSEDIYYYYVIAVNDWGTSEPSNLVSVKPKLTQQPTTPDDTNGIFGGLMLSLWVILIFIVIVMVYLVLTRVSKVKSGSDIKKPQEQISPEQSSFEQFESEPSDTIIQSKLTKPDEATKPGKATKLKGVKLNSKSPNVEYRKTKNGPKNSS